MNDVDNYTVVLLRPDYLCTEPYGQDVYVAHIRQETMLEALQFAQEEAYDADVAEGFQPEDYLDYALVVMFRGLHTPTIFGTQI